MILMIISDDTNFSGTSYTSNPTVTLGTDCTSKFQVKFFNFHTKR